MTQLSALFRRFALVALPAVMSALAVAQDAAQAAEQSANSAPEAVVVVTIDTAAPSKPYSPMLFGGFIEHFNDQIYGGLFEPGSPLSDEHGFRKDVIAAMKELKLPVVRWPGGCFVSPLQWFCRC